MRKMKKLYLHLGSLKQQMLYYNVILLAFVLVIVFVSIQSNRETLDNYDAFSTQYSSLSSFYREMNTAGIAAQNYLYGKSPDNLRMYKQQTQTAHEKLNQLEKSARYPELRWRITLLRNMVNTHEETFDRLCENSFDPMENYASEYDFLVSTAGNIGGTAPQYYNLLTEEMNKISVELEARWHLRITFTLVITACMLLISITFSTAYIWSITSPIQKIVKNINKIKQGQYNLKEVSHAGKEIAVLCDAFDDMAQSVQLHIASVEENADLEKRLLETENQNLKMNELLMETELKALQGQMNPHFLFNTLGMISNMAYMENAPQTSALMENVSDLLRYSLDKSSKTSDLLGEIECIRNYYVIQNKRIGHRVAFTLSVTNNLRNLPMPGMVVQPLIENAILHGVAHMTSGGKIDVRVIQDDAHTYLSVQDNGCGIEQDIVQKLQSRQDDSISKTGTNIGLRNVLKRLRIFYGDAFSAAITSDLGEGTLVVLALPGGIGEDADV